MHGGSDGGKEEKRMKNLSLQCTIVNINPTNQHQPTRTTTQIDSWGSYSNALLLNVKQKTVSMSPPSSPLSSLWIYNINASFIESEKEAFDNLARAGEGKGGEEGKGNVCVASRVLLSVSRFNRDSKLNRTSSFSSSLLDHYTLSLLVCFRKK